jgi:hypothetical protein
MGAVADGHAARFERWVSSTWRGVRPSHEVAVVAASVVVAVQPGVGFGLELAEGPEASAMERRTPAFLQGGPLESFAHGVVVRAAGRDAVVHQAKVGEVVPEPQRRVFGTVVIWRFRTASWWRNTRIWTSLDDLRHATPTDRSPAGRACRSEPPVSGRSGRCSERLR